MLYNLINDKLVDIIERIFQGKALCILHVIIGMLSSRLMQSEIIIYGYPLSEDNKSDVIEAFNSTSRYLDDLLNIDNNFFDSMTNRIYPSEL